MRFRGGGIGHTVTREWDEFLRNDGATPSNYEDMEVEESQKLDGDDNEDEDASEESLSMGSDDGEELVDDDDVFANEGYSTL